MKKNIRTILTCIAAAFAFCYLLLFPEHAVLSARDGLLLWYRSVLPVLFPFMFLCGLMLRFNLLDYLIPLIMKPFHFLFGCSGYGAFAIITGFLCGFPMGAKITSDLYRQKKISQKEAFFLYGFVNNLSPAFIVSFVAADQLGQPGWGGLFLFNILGSAVIYGILTSFSYRKNSPSSSAAKPEHSRPQKAADTFALIDECIYDTISGTVRLGAYIMLFSILGNAVSLLPVGEHPLTVFLTACIEVTSGVRILCRSSFPLWQKYLMVNALCTFGGLSALAQTAGIASMDSGVLKHYIKSRVNCTLLSSLITAISILFSSFFLG